MPGPVVARHHADARAAAVVAHDREQHLAARGVGRDVARHLGDRGREQRLVRARELEARGELPRALARGHDVVVGLDRDPLLGAQEAPSPAPPGLEQRETLLEVQRRLDVLEVHPELDHREGHLGLDADDHRLGAAQARHHRDPAQRAGDEGVHDVERRDVDDDPARAVAGHLAHHVVAQLQDVGVGERRLDRRDQERTLLEDRYGHALLPRLLSSAPATPSETV